MVSSPPLWMVFTVQAVSVAGDQLGQRASRKDYQNSSRRMLIALTLISSLQIFFILGILQLSLPAHITGAIYEDHDKETCYREVDLDGHGPNWCDPKDNPHHVCHKIDCPSQGPFSMFRSMTLHPLLWLNGFIDVAYYIGEVLLYHHPLGLVFIVMAALTASFIIAPIEKLMGISGGSSVPASVIVLGVLGALFCVIEKRIPETVNLRKVYHRLKLRLMCKEVDEREELTSSDSSGSPKYEAIIHDEPIVPSSSAADASFAASAPDSSLGMPGVAADDHHYAAHEMVMSPTSESTAQATKKTMWQMVRGGMAVFFPFMLLSVTYGLWFVTQKAFNDTYRTNVFGYTAIDQVWTPVYMWPTLLLVDSIGVFRRGFLSAHDQEETFLQALRGALSQLFKLRGRAFYTVFFYRLLINARAMAYFYMSVTYDLDRVYIELTLVRIVLSWIAAVLVCKFAPRFIDLQGGERNTVFHPLNLTAKCIGTAFIIAALFILG